MVVVREEEVDRERVVSRRTLMRAGVWAAPAIAIAAAVPAATASPEPPVDLGALTVVGHCGAGGVLNDGFDITAGSGGIPVGTTISIVLTGGASITFQPGQGIVVHPDGDSATYTFTSALAANGTRQLRVLAAATGDAVVTATLTLPSGYVAGAGSKTVGTLTFSIAGIGPGGTPYCTAA